MARSDRRDLRRRSFLKLCAGAGVAVGVRPSMLAATTGSRTPSPPARLVHPDGSPMATTDLEVGRSYVFHYPYAVTPCFLIDLGRPAQPQDRLETDDGRRYRWQGGTGQGKSVVAFSAICAHRMSYPTRTVSFINYHHDGAVGRQESVIYCCSEGSVYDPAAGARVLDGPAPQPLAAVDLEWEEASGSLTATGTYGGEMFERFFETFDFRLRLEHGDGDPRQPVGPTTPVWTLEEYCANAQVC